MKINSKKIITLTIFLLILSSLIIWTVYFCLIKNPSPEKQLEKLNQEYCLADDEIANYVEKIEMPVVISIKDKETKEEKYSFQIENADLKHYHPMELLV